MEHQRALHRKGWRGYPDGVIRPTTASESGKSCGGWAHLRETPHDNTAVDRARMMQEFKSSTSRLARLFKKSREAWKEKALERQQRLRAWQVKIRDLEQSRDRWKTRALEAEQALAGACAEPRKEEETAGSLVEVEKSLALSPPAGHHYSVMVMELAMRMMLDASVGSRGVHRVFEMLGRWFPVAAPAYTSVLNWVYRCGLHVLNRPVERRTDWILVLDHTIGLGQSKCLLVLGIPASELQRTGYSPAHHDMQVIAVEVTEHSTGPWVAEVLERVDERIGTPVQIVADHGSDLSKGIALYQEQSPEPAYTYDISHGIANLLKSELDNDPCWNGFLANCRKSFASFQQSDLAFLLPPRQRTKARYMHFDAHVEWAQRMLGCYDRGDFSEIRSLFLLSWPAWEMLEQQFGPAAAQPLRSLVAVRYTSEAAFRLALETKSELCLDAVDDAFWHTADAGRSRFLEGFGWLLDDRADLAEYAQLMELSKLIQASLKTKGLRQGAGDDLRAQLPALSTLPPRVARVIERILEHVDLESAKVPDHMAWLASSDIIESVFGKYKHFTAKGPLKEIGKLVLAIPAFVSGLSTDLIREAMETVRTADVDTWVDTHLGKSMLARRRNVLRPLSGDIKTA